MFEVSLLQMFLDSGIKYGDTCAFLHVSWDVNSGQQSSISSSYHQAYFCGKPLDMRNSVLENLPNSPAFV